MLGGDEKHTVLVKGLTQFGGYIGLCVDMLAGLDFALLEQQRAKLDRTQDIQDDTLLEQAFKEVTAPRKRTREEIVEELKKSRGPSSTIPISDNSLETVKATGKFRPIGAPVETRVKKRKNKVVTDNSEKKSKKRKKEEDTSLVEETVIATADPKKVATDHLMSPARMPSPEIDADADIFADVGEYHGLGSESGSDGDTDEENEGKRDNASSTARSVVADTRKMDWFGNPVEEAKQEKLAERPAERQPAKARGPLPPPEPDLPEELEPEQPSRLQPLASSSVPSIREILAMDEAAEKEEKRKARKEKKKNKKPSETTKIDREVKQYVSCSKFRSLLILQSGWNNTLPQKNSYITTVYCYYHRSLVTDIRAIYM